MKYLGVDWGLKRVGLAISEGEVASPLEVLTIKGLEDGINQLGSVIDKEGIDLVVVGKPEGEMGKLVDRLAGNLRKRGINFQLSDETLSTQEAKKVMLESGVGKKKRREDNALSAAIILQRYLDEKI